MSRKKQAKKGLPWFVWCLLATIVWGLYFITFTEPGTNARRNLFSRAAGAESRFYDPVPDPGLRAAFAAFSGAIGAERPIVLKIEPTTEQYEVRKEPYRPGSGRAAFVVKPNQYALFARPGFADRVSEGLKAFGILGTNEIETAKLFDSWRVFTNATDRTWTVELSGVRPAGRIRLELGEASDEIRISLPKLIKIWNKSYSFEKGSGELSFAGVGKLLALDRCKPGEEWRSFVPPSVEQQLCGFRLLCVTSQCAWLEIVYTEPVAKEKIRERWPPADVEFAVLDNGKSLSEVKFGGGYEALAGDSITFEEGDRILLDLEGAFLSRDAVLFRYQDRDENPVADILCITRLK